MSRLGRWAGQVCGCEAVVERYGVGDDEVVVRCSCSVWATSRNGHCDQCNANHHELRGRRL